MNMRAKRYRISEAHDWPDIISCCRHMIRRGKHLGLIGTRFECYMKDRNGKMVLAVRAFKP